MKKTVISPGSEPLHSFPPSKRWFDIAICIATIWMWLPLMAIIYLLILIFSGRPVLYFSARRVYQDKTANVAKFRTMFRNAERIANRDTIPVKDQRFLNIPLDSPIYTGIGRRIEKYCLTELPQFFHVLSGKMSLIGNRPLPENVIRSLKEKYHYAEDRFATKSGMTGPVQLVGRDNLSDSVRLRIELLYCRSCQRKWSLWLDFLILFYTVLIALRIRKKMTVEDIESLISCYSSAPTPLDLCDFDYTCDIERKR